MQNQLLKLKRKDQVAFLNKKLEQNISEFKNFIYRTSHDVRGPIASIKGLIYLARLETKSPELLDYFERMSRMADKLDFILEHLHESSANLLGLENYQYEALEYPMFINQVMCRVGKLKDLFDLDLETRLEYYPENFVFNNNPRLIFGLIENLLLILTSSIDRENGKIQIEFQPHNEEIIIDIRNLSGNINLLIDALKNILRYEEDGFSEDAGFNNLHLNIFRNCLKATGSGIHGEMTIEDPMIRLTIPSLVINTSSGD